MIQVEQLGKKFQVANPKKLSEQEKKDPRLKGRFFHSIEKINFQCDKGQVLGLLGPNGAGKTTTLRVLSTALQANQGAIYINGENLTKKPEILRKKLGFLSGSTGLYGRLSGRENIEYFGRLHKMPEPAIAQRIDEMSELLDMEAFLDRRSETYSTGMKQKTAIARAVIHEPEVVILDEPTTGLDIMATQTVLDFIQRLKEKGTPVIFSTHHLDEVQELCDAVTIIDQGKTCFNGSLQEFINLSQGTLHQSFMQALKSEQGAQDVAHI